MVGSANPKVDAFLEKETRWREAFVALRNILQGCDLVEDLKWGVPCYTHKGKNVVLIHGFKEYCALLFIKGSLLKDPAGLLVQQTANVQAGRQVRFGSLEEIVSLGGVLVSYVEDAIGLEDSGARVDFKGTVEFGMPEELRVRFVGDPSLRVAFESLTPGRQRAYLLHFSQPKQEKTRVSRIEKCIPGIRAGKGLNE